MRCDRVQELYEDYVRSSLEPAAMGRIEEHLGACAACRMAYERGDALGRLLVRHAEVPHPGPQYFGDLATRVLQRLDDPAGETDPTVQDSVSPGWAGGRGAAAWFARRPLWWAGGLAAAGLLALGLRPDAAPRKHRELAALNVPRGVAAIRPEQTPAHPLPVARRNGAVSILSIPGLKIPPSTLSAIRTIAKGVIDGQAQRRPPAVASGAAAPKPAGGADKAPERAGAAGGEVKLVAARTAAPKGMPPEVAQQIDMIKTRIAADGGGEAFKRELRLLEETVDRRNGDRGALAAMPWVRESRLYLKADAELAAGHPKEAGANYSNILMIDDGAPEADRSSPLALRAALQLGDLYYSEWADFRAARDYYARCAGPRAAEALTAVEREHVSRQLDRLARYAAANWETLQLLHIVRRENWPEATTALRKLLGDPEAAPLLPETARALAERMNGTAKPPSGAAVEIYKLLAKRAEVEQNGDIRAWIELSLGDMALSQRDPQQAIENYRKAVADGGTAAAAQSARAKLDDLIERQLTDMVR